LSPSTTYFFYENASINAGVIFGGNAYAGHQFYFSSASGSNFAGQGAPLNFRVTGNAVPEPSAMALIFTAVVAGLFWVRRGQR
jgi:hypothetical protein